MLGLVLRDNATIAKEQRKDGNSNQSSSGTVAVNSLFSTVDDAMVLPSQEKKCERTIKTPHCVCWCLGGRGAVHSCFFIAAEWVEQEKHDLMKHALHKLTKCTNVYKEKSPPTTRRRALSSLLSHDTETVDRR